MKGLRFVDRCCAHRTCSQLEGKRDGAFKIICFEEDSSQFFIRSRDIVVGKASHARTTHTLKRYYLSQFDKCRKLPQLGKASPSVWMGAFSDAGLCQTAFAAS